MEVLGWSQAALQSRLLNPLELLQVFQALGTGVVEALKVPNVPPPPQGAGARPAKHFAMRAHADVIKGPQAEPVQPPQGDGSEGG